MNGFDLGRTLQGSEQNVSCLSSSSSPPFFLVEIFGSLLINSNDCAHLLPEDSSSALFIQHTGPWRSGKDTTHLLFHRTLSSQFSSGSDLQVKAGRDGLPLQEFSASPKDENRIFLILKWRGISPGDCQAVT